MKIKIYRTVILPFVVYGCETWSLTWREERRRRVFKNRVMRIFGPKRDEITREWSKIHNEELNELYFSPNIFQVIKSNMRWVRLVALWGRVEVHTGFWLGNLRVRNHLEDPGIDGRIILRWIMRNGDGGMDWIDLAQDRDKWRVQTW
jgi:hypothetical protein